MAEHVQDRYFAGFGIASVVLMFAGLIIGSTDHDRTLTITSSPAQVARAVGSPAGSGTWAGAYIELLSFGFFLAFAVWACAKLGGGLLGQVARACATSYATLSIASLAVLDAVAYRSGKGLSAQLGSTLVTVNEALYVGSWFLAVFFLLSVGALALSSGHRVLGRSAIAVAVIQLVTTAVSLDNLGQMSFTLWLVWIVGASIALARGTEEPVPARAVPQRA